jgi:predicted MFS family arabinose efflux permease
MDRDLVRGWVAVALVALGATVAQAFGRFTYSVLLPAVRDDLGLSNSIAGFLGTVNVAAYLLGTLLVIRATARLRLVTLMRTGMVLAVVGLAVASIAPGGVVLAVALVVLGLGGACIWIPSPALAAAAVPDERRGIAVGLIGAGIGLGIVSAGQLATALRDRLGDQAWQDVYRIEAVVGLVVAIVIIALLRPVDDPVPSRTSSGFAVLRTMDGWRALTASYAAFGLSYLLALTYLTARLEDDAGFTEAAASSVFAASGLAGIFGGVLLGWMTDRLGPRRVLVIGFVGISAAGAAILTGVVPVVYSGALLLGLMFSGVPSVIAVYIVQHSDATTYGPRYAVATLAFGVAQVSAPQLGGLIADLTGTFSLVFVLSAVTALLGALFSWRLPRTPSTTDSPTSTAAAGTSA